MTLDSIIMPLIGGALIGLSAIGLMLFNGKIAGVSGILSSVLQRFSPDTLWRVAFIAGLLGGGLILQAVFPAAFASKMATSIPVLALGGFLVGFGTRLGSGCTSGHGVCGLSRLSPRSMVATVAFVASGALTVLVARSILGGAL